MKKLAFLFVTIAGLTAHAATNEILDCGIVDQVPGLAVTSFKLLVRTSPVLTVSIVELKAQKPPQTFETERDPSTPETSVFSTFGYRIELNNNANANPPATFTENSTGHKFNCFRSRN